MPSLIKILPDHVINKIAAGEVVERPASVVKELIENSIDAGATEICIDIEQAGVHLIRVTDNGGGMSADDAKLAFERHATSKIADDADLEAIRTMGFRGEALSSIASVSRVKLVTALKGMTAGVMVELESGRVAAVADAAAPQGASLEISRLFSNTPARLKFLKSPATEFSHIVTAVSRQAMAHPYIRFRLTHNNKTTLDLPPSVHVKERAFQLYGTDLANNLLEFEGGRDPVRVRGLLSRPGYTRADKTYQDFYVNRRAVRNLSLTHALYAAYGDALMRDRHPAAFIFIDIDAALVDVNVHPAKSEVRFRNQTQIHDFVRDAVREGLRSLGPATAGDRTASRQYGERVHEAVSQYIGNVPANGDARAPETPSPFFGRRKRDAELASLQRDYLVPEPREYSTGLPPRAADTPERYIYPVAQVHDSFIIAQSPGGMSIVDQHAAHERVLFEKLQDQYGTGAVAVQNLLMPLQMELAPAQAELISEQLAGLAKLGFIVEPFGGATFVVKAVPSLLAGGDPQQTFLDILDEISVHGKSGKIEELRDLVLGVMACHPAVKVHRKLELREMEKLLSDLFKCRMPYTCPHGRPTVIQFSIDEIKRLFKRA